MAKLKKRGKNWYSYFKACGKRIYRSLGPDHAAAQIALPKLVLLERSRCKRFGPGDRSLIAFRIRYIQHREALGLDYKTIQHDKNALQVLEASFPVKSVSDITPDLLNELKKKLIKQGMKNAALNRKMVSIVEAMKQAVQWGLADPHNWKLVKRLPEIKGKLRFYSHEECHSLLKDEEACEYLPVIYLGMMAGLRLGEIYWLTWSDIDFNLSVISIRSKEGWNTKRYVQRNIPVDDVLMNYLKSISRPGGFVFDRTGVSENALSKAIRRLFKRVKIGGSAHTLRHTYASHLVQNGVDLEELKLLMGHSSIATTQIYAHLRPGALRAAARKMPNFLMPLVAAPQ